MFVCSYFLFFGQGFVPTHDFTETVINCINLTLFIPLEEKTQPLVSSYGFQASSSGNILSFSTSFICYPLICFPDDL